MLNMLKNNLKVLLEFGADNKDTMGKILKNWFRKC